MQFHISISYQCCFKTIKYKVIVNILNKLLALNLLTKKTKKKKKQQQKNPKKPHHFKSLVSPSPQNEFMLASMPLCSVCNISSHVYVNHEAYRTTIALVNICARYNNPLLPNLQLNAKCPNQSERQQKQEIFQQ